MPDALDDFLDRLKGGVESTGDPRAKNPKSSASGEYQMLDGTWHALGNPGHAGDASPEEQRAQARILAQQNASLLQRYGIPVQPDTEYLAWQQGPGGGRALLANPNDTAIDALVKGGMKPALAEQAVLNNGGTRDMKASDFAQRVEGRFTGAKMPGATAAIDPSGGSDVLRSALAAYNDYPNSPAGKQALETIKRFRQDGADERTALDEKGAMLGREEAAFAKISADEPVPPKPPELPDEQKIKDAELAKVSDQPGDPTRVMGQFLPMVAILFGALGSRGAINSLNAAGKAMQAAKQNDEEALQRAHQTWLDSMDETIKTANMQRQAWQDIVERNKDKKADLITEAGIYAAQLEIPSLKAAADTGDLDAIGKFQQQRNAAIEPLIRIYQAANSQQKVAPPTQAYDTAFADAKADGKSDEEATKIAGEAMKGVELDAKPGLEGTQERAAKASFEKEPDVQFYQKAEPYFAIIDDVLANPTRKQTNPEQLQILDAFTKTATGGQAIRKFMAQSGVDSQSYLSQLEVARSKLSADNGLTLDPKVMLQYAQAADIARKAQQQLYDQKLADDANAEIKQGLDPSNILPSEDLDRAVQEGLVKLPNGQSAPADQHPTMSANDVKQSVLNARKALRADPSKRAQIEQKLRDNHIDPALALGNN